MSFRFLTHNFLVLVLVAVVLPLAQPAAAQAASPAILPPLNTCFAEYTGDGVTDFSSMDASAVQDAVDAVASGGVVKVAGYCPGVQVRNTTTQTVYISQTLTLQGGYTDTDWNTYDPLANPTILDAQGLGRVVRAEGVTVTVAGLTVTNGSFTGVGGGMLIGNGGLTLTNVMVYSNTNAGANNGAGLYVSTTAHILNSAFLSNAVTASGASGGGAYFNGPAFVTATTFIRNKAGGGALGGGAHFATVGSVMAVTFMSNTANTGGGASFFGATTIDSSLFQANIAQQSGGAQTFAAATITGSAFISNTSSLSGGGMNIQGAANITATTFMGNNTNAQGGGFQSTQPISLYGVSVVGNRALSNGGGASFFNAALISNTRFVDNRSNTNGGGAFFNLATGARQINNALFAGNLAANGVGIYVANAATLRVLHTTIVSPTLPTGNGQAVYVAAGTVYITDTLIASHTVGIQVAGGSVTENYNLFSNVTTPYVGTPSSANSLTGTAAFVNPALGNYHLSQGSAAIDAGVNVGIANDFEGDPRPQLAGYDIGYDEAVPLCFTEYTGDGVTDFMSLDASALRDAVAAATAGQTVKVAGVCAGAVGGYVVSITQTLTLQGGYTNTNWTTFDPVANPTTLDALAMTGDRVVNVAADGVTLDGLHIINGRSTTGSFDDGAGVVVSAGSMFTLSRSVVHDNAVGSLLGGGAGVFVTSGSAYVTGTTFFNNTLGAGLGDGGGLFVTNGGRAWVYNSNFYTNTANQGGGISVQGSANLYLQDSYLAGNVATGNGGGVFVGGQLFLTRTTFYNNQATYGGGAAYPLNGATLTASTFISNSAGEQGGAVRVQNRFLVVRNSTFLSNTASSNGGAVQVSNNNATLPSILENNLFQGNWTNGQGGAASFEGSNTFAVFTVTANLFRDNVATNGGGALHFYNGAYSYLTNNFFFSNTTTSGPEALDLGRWNPPPPLAGRAPEGGSSAPAQVWGWHNTFAATNSGSGLAVRAGTFMPGEALTLTNSIFDGYATGAAVDTMPASIRLAGVLWHNVTAQTSGNNITVTSAYTGDPLFVNRAAGNLHIVQDSAAFNRALASGVTTDYDGEPRPALGGPDLGADEMQTMLPPNCYATIDGTTVYATLSANALRDMVAEAAPGATVKVAGYCAGAVNGYVVTIDKALTVRGGYTSTNWNASNPVANPTTLDALAITGDRVVNVAADGVTLDGLHIINGRSTTGTFDEGAGVVVSAGSMFTLSRSVVHDNAVGSLLGGGAGVFVTSGSAYVTGTTFFNNTLGAGLGDGGGLFVTNGGRAWVYNSNFYTNTAQQGGGISVQGSSNLYLQDSYLAGNVATGNGGGVFVGGQLFLTRTTFYNNQATYGGGAAYPLNGATLTASTFISNSAGEQGGAVRVQNRFLVVRNSTFLSNTAGSNGGAVQVSNNNATLPSILENNVFQGNWTNGQGGAASFEGSNTFAVFTVTANLFRDNFAANGGGALDIFNGARAYLTNNIFFSNTTTTGPEALEVGSGPLTLAPEGGSSAPAQVWGWHNTFAAANSGSGLALRVGTNVNGEAITLTNSIFDGYATGASVGQRPASIRLDGVLWHNVTTQTVGNNITVTAAYTGNPLFVNRAAGNLHILQDSAAFNNAVATSVTTDYDGDPRPALGAPDLGADELQAANYTLTVATAGTGTGVVTPAAGVYTYSYGSVVTLTASASISSTFAGWSGACSGTGNCVVTMTGNRNVIATFNISTYTQTAATAGNGSGVITPTVGAYTYTYGTVVTFTASPNFGSTFTGWNGDCSGTGNCVLVMTGTRTITATFALNTYTLTVATAGNGSGVVTPTVGSYTYTHGSVVTLTASANTGSTFAGWSGACSGTGNCVVTMTGNRSVTATFTLNAFNLNVATSGSGVVTSNPAGINCGITCTAPFAPGTVVTLTAAANSGNVFTGWSGACTGVGNCLVTMTATRSVTATFVASSRTLNVFRAGTGAGVVTSNPAGINCGTDCTESYTQTQQVALTATATITSVFTGWSGDCNTIGANGECNVVVNGPTNVTANFTALDPNLYGYITSTPSGGTVVTYSMVITSQVPQTNLVLTASLPVGVLNFLGTNGTYFPSGGEFGTGYVSRTVPSLAANQPVTLTWAVRGQWDPTEVRGHARSDYYAPGPLHILYWLYRTALPLMAQTAVFNAP